MLTADCLRHHADHCRLAPAKLELATQARARVAARETLSHNDLAASRGKPAAFDYGQAARISRPMGAKPRSRIFCPIRCLER